MILSQSMRKQIQKKVISTSRTEDGVNYKNPTVRHVDAKKSESAGSRRKTWKPSENPFPNPSPSLNSEDSLENFSDDSLGFKQKMNKFHVPEPEPEPVS
jgi:hypothetical protein